MVVEDVHRQMFNLDLGGVVEILNLSNDFRGLHNKDTYNVSRYVVYIILEWGCSHHNNKHTRSKGWLYLNQ